MKGLSMTQDKGGSQPQDYLELLADSRAREHARRYVRRTASLWLGAIVVAVVAAASMALFLGYDSLEAFLRQVALTETRKYFAQKGAEELRQSISKARSDLEKCSQLRAKLEKMEEDLRGAKAIEKLRAMEERIAALRAEVRQPTVTRGITQLSQGGTLELVVGHQICAFKVKDIDVEDKGGRLRLEITKGRYATRSAPQFTLQTRKKREGEEYLLHSSPNMHQVRFPEVGSVTFCLLSCRGKWPNEFARLKYEVKTELNPSDKAWLQSTILEDIRRALKRAIEAAAERDGEDTDSGGNKN